MSESSAPLVGKEPGPSCPREHRMLAEVPLAEEVVLCRFRDLGPEVEVLLENGVIPGCRLCPVRRCPAGGPTIYRVDGSLVALRRETASCLCVRSVSGSGAVLNPS